MEKIKAKLYYTFGSVYIPNSLVKNRETKILHISDTPTIFYPVLSKIIKKIRPKYIIHTGDLVDNVKLSLYPSKKEEYIKGVYTLLNILENSPAQEIYISLGNHDDKEIISSIATKSFIIEKTQIIRIENIQFKISHYCQDIINSPAKYNLFGHDITLNNKVDNGIIYLNGIKSINIITPTSEQIFSLPYPLGTNDSRLGKFKMGI
ncbi:MAG: hypothetical protein PWQ67_2653 [Clostridia bacterium]|jgi:Icc-related predicted phosphoesterase|nr:hypothetical protein [Clostridia bacterium]